LGPGDWQVHTHLGQALEQLDQHDQALNHWHEALRLSVDNPQAQVRLHNLIALQAARRGKIDRAVAQWQKAVHLDPDNVVALYSLRPPDLSLAFDWLASRISPLVARVYAILSGGVFISSSGK
jgi:Flp pilus assembly protein TadD